MKDIGSVFFFTSFASKKKLLKSEVTIQEKSYIRRTLHWFTSKIEKYKHPIGYKHSFIYFKRDALFEMYWRQILLVFAKVFKQFFIPQLFSCYPKPFLLSFIEIIIFL